MGQSLFGIHGKALELRSQRLGLITSGIGHQVASFLNGRSAEGRN